MESSKKSVYLDESVQSNIDDYFSVVVGINDISDSEGSRLVCFSQQSNCLHNQSINYNSDNSFKNHYLKPPLATSSPFIKTTCIKNKYKNKTCLKDFDKTTNSYSVHNTLNSLNKSNYMLETENQNQEQFHTTNITQHSEMCFNNMTQIFNQKQSLVTLQKHCFSKKISSQEMTNNSIVVNSLSNKTSNSSMNDTKHNNKHVNNIHHVSSLNVINKIPEKVFHLNTTVFQNLQTSNKINKIKDYLKCDEYYRNETDSSELFQMQLSLKMFPGNNVPYLNRLKHDILQFMNSCKHKPYMQLCKKSKNINEIISNIQKMIKLNVIKCANIKSYEKNHSTIPFVPIDVTSLNILCNKLDHVNTILETLQLSLHGKLLKKNISVDKNNESLDFNNPNKTFDLESFESVLENGNNIAYDSFDHIREPNKSITLLPSIIENIDFHKSSQEPFLKNNSLKYIDEVSDKDILEMSTPIINLSYKEVAANSLISINNSNCNIQVDNCTDNLVEGNTKPYWLRNRPRTTDLYFAPFQPPTKKKKCRTKTCSDDVFICKKKGKNKVILQYKMHSILKANSNELMKKLCSDNKNSKLNRDSSNTSFFDISKIKSKKIETPCPCGIFSSQVPSTWSNSLHKSLHQNLYKLQLKSQTIIDTIAKVNDNGFLYDIIKINGNCNDENLHSTLKNVQDFIDLEIDFSKKNNYNLNHSIFLAVIPSLKIIGYLEVETLKEACIYENNNQLSDNLIAVKFGVTKLWVMVKYRNNGVATKLLNQFCNDEHLETNDLAFAYHGNYGISFIKKYFTNNSVLIY